MRKEREEFNEMSCMKIKARCGLKLEGTILFPRRCNQYSFLFRRK
jgi:hypothetical protein